MIGKFLGLLCVAAGLSVSSIQAAPVTLIVDGVQSSYSDPDNRLPFADGGTGTAWRLTLTYESDTAELSDIYPYIPDDPNVGIYPYAITDAVLQIGNWSTGLINPGNALIANDFPDASSSSVDNWAASTGRTLSSYGPTDPDSGLPSLTLLQRFGFYLYQEGSGGEVPQALASDSLVEPDWPGLWQGGEIWFSESESNSIAADSVTLAEASATITSITVVPIPAAFWLFATGLGVLFARISRRSHQRT